MRFLPIVIAASLLSTTSMAEEVAYISNEKDDTISVISMDNLEVINTIDVGDRPGVFC